MVASPRGERVVTVIVPTHGRAEYLDDCVRSVLDQTYRDLQLLIIDSACTVDVANRVARLGDERISVVRYEKDQGSVANIFRAFDHGQEGPVIVFHDDDTMHPRMVEHQVAVLEEDPALVFIATGYAPTQDHSAMTTFPVVEKRVTCFPRPVDLVSYLISSGDLHFGSVMYRAGSVRQLAFDPSPFGIFCDRPFLLAIAESGPSAVLGGPWMNWRRHPAQDTQRLPATVDNVLALLRSYRDIVEREGEEKLRTTFLRFSTNTLLASYVRLPARTRGSLSDLIATALRDRLLSIREIRRPGAAALLRLALRIARQGL